MHKFVIGIDPGANGGVAVLDMAGDLVTCYKLSKDYQENGDVVSKLPQDSVCYMEKVGGGRPGQSVTATATFARHVGGLEMALYLRGISTVMVTPGRWQKDFRLLSKPGESKVLHKTRIKLEAQRRYAAYKVTLWSSDALMIASWGVEQERDLVRASKLPPVWTVDTRLSQVENVDEYIQASKGEEIK